MSRLIDADALLQAMDKRYKKKKDIVPNNLAEGFMQMEKLIKEQPTAFNVEKIVSELKIGLEDECLNSHDQKIYSEAIRCAIKIVKGRRISD